jgi:GntR family transcriptional regulator
MRIRLDRNRKEGLLEQARDQIISGLHAGLLRQGDRLPSLRQVATLSDLNVKTVMRIYTQLQREGLLALRKGSGAFVAVQYPNEFEHARAASLLRLLHRHLDEVSGMNISPEAYATLIQRLITRRNLEGRSVGVLECNEEQVDLFATEIKARIGVAAHPILLAHLREGATASLIGTCSILAVTDFHFKEGTEIARRFHKPLARLRLKRDFVPALMGAARQGHLAMIVSNTSFFPAFKRALGLLGLQHEHLDQISAVAGSERPAVRRAVGLADFIYISPLCDREIRGLVPAGKRLLHFAHHIADDSIEELESWLLLSSTQSPRDHPVPQ